MTTNMVVQLRRFRYSSGIEYNYKYGAHQRHGELLLDISLGTNARMLNVNQLVHCVAFATRNITIRNSQCRIQGPYKHHTQYCNTMCTDYKTDVYQCYRYI